MKRLALLAGILCMAALLIDVGCASIGEGYSTRYGLMSTEKPQIQPQSADESYGGGLVGIQEIEAYEKKYQERDVIKHDDAPQP